MYIVVSYYKVKEYPEWRKWDPGTSKWDLRSRNDIWGTSQLRLGTSKWHLGMSKWYLRKSKRQLETNNEYFIDSNISDSSVNKVIYSLHSDIIFSWNLNLATARRPRGVLWKTCKNILGKKLDKTKKYVLITKLAWSKMYVDGLLATKR